MSCGRDILREGARGGKPLPPPSNSLPQPRKFKFRQEHIGAFGSE